MDPARPAVAALLLSFVACGSSPRAPESAASPATSGGGTPASPAVSASKGPRCADAGGCKKLCDAGDSASCGRLAALLHRAKGAAADAAAARVAAEHACGLGSAEGCFVRGEIALREDARAAGRYLRQACNDGSADGCALLGVLTVDGRGVPKDPELAIEFWERACKADSALGCHNLAFSYERGTHLTQDDIKAARLHEKACGLGSAMSCRDLGQMHDEGRGVREDEAAARAAYEKACNGGDPLACGTLKSLDDRTHPVEKAFVRVIDVGYAGPRFSRNQRDKAAAKRRAQSAVAKLNAGGDFARVAAELDDREGVGGADRERIVFKQKTSSPFLDATFSLRPGQAASVDHPLFGFQVIYRTR